MHLLFGFSGRIGRGSWWLAQLAVLLMISAAIVVLIGVVGTGRLARDLSAEGLGGADVSVFVVIAVTVLLICWVNLASTVKRFHDRDKSGFWVLIIFIPYIGTLWQIVECGCLSGSDGSNSYGPPDGLGPSGSLDHFSQTVEAEYSRPERQAVAQDPAAASAPSAMPPRRATSSGFGRRGLT